MRKLCAGVLVVVWLIAGCQGGTGTNRTQESGRLRLGYFPNITHAQAVLGVADGSLEEAAGVRLEPRLLDAGPSAITALLAGEIDALYVGPSPAVNGFMRSGGQALRIVAGSASGGAVFVLRPGADPGHLAGTRLATPGLANTQDVALRQYLDRQGLGPREKGGSVLVSPMAGADMLNLFKQGQLDGAWVAEPWGARAEEAGGVVALDERDLWPGGKFATTVVVVSSKYLKSNPVVVTGLLKGHAAKTRWILANPDEARRRLQAELAKLQGKPLPDGVMARAFGRVDFTTDPLESTIQEMADRAYGLGLLGSSRPNLTGLIDLTLLKEAEH